MRFTKLLHVHALHRTIGSCSSRLAIDGSCRSSSAIVASVSLATPRTTPEHLYLAPRNRCMADAQCRAWRLAGCVCCLAPALWPSIEELDAGRGETQRLMGSLACPKRPEPDVPALAVFWSPAGDNRALHPPLLCVGDVAVCAAEPAAPHGPFLPPVRSHAARSASAQPRLGRRGSAHAQWEQRYERQGPGGGLDRHARGCCLTCL